MGELTNYLLQKYSKGNTGTEDIMRKTKVKNKLLEVCEMYLNPGDELILEVLPKDLEYVMLVFNEEPLKSTVMASQIAENMFSVRYIEVELG